MEIIQNELDGNIDTLVLPVEKASFQEELPRGEAGELESIHLDTNTVPMNKRFAYWQSVFGEHVEVKFDPNIPLEAFHQVVNGYVLNDLLISTTHSSAKSYRQKDGSREYFINSAYVLRLFLSGGYKGEVGGQQIDLGPGDVCLMDMSSAFNLHILTSDTLTVLIPRDELLAYTRTGKINAEQIIRGDTAIGRILAHQFMSIWRQLPNTKVKDAAAMKRMLLEVIAGAFGLVQKPGERKNRSLDKATLRAVRDYMDANLHKPLDVAQLCQYFGCSRSKLYRLFAPLGGIAEYIRRQRLRRCFDMLVHADLTHQRIVDIGAYWGFENHSHFCRVFRQAFGISPSEASQWGGESRQILGNSPDAGHAFTLHRWLTNSTGWTNSQVLME